MHVQVVINVSLGDVLATASTRAFYPSLIWFWPPVFGCRSSAEALRGMSPSNEKGVFSMAFLDV